MNERRMNTLLSKVERLSRGVLGKLKRSYGYRRARHIGLEKNVAESMFKAMAYNLRRADRLCGARAGAIA